MIETERLLLRPFAEEDEELIYRLYSDADLLRYTPFDPMNREQAAEHLRAVMEDWQSTPKISFEFAVLLRETGEKIGRAHILVDPETDTGMIGGLLFREQWNRHYATEIAKSLTAYCFRNLKLHRVNAVCNPENIASWKMLEGIGMRREALFRQKCRYVKNGITSWEDELEYAILASEYEEKYKE